MKWILAAVVLAAVVVRMAYVWTQPVGQLNWADEKDFDQIGWRLASTGRFESDPYWATPSFPVFLAAVYRVAGHNYRAVRLAQSVLAGALVLAVYGIGASLFGRVTGYVAAVGVALYPPLIYLAGVLYAEHLYAVLLAAAVFCLVKWWEAGGRGEGRRKKEEGTADIEPQRHRGHRELPQAGTLAPPLNSQRSTFNVQRTMEAGGGAKREEGGAKTDDEFHHRDTENTKNEREAESGAETADSPRRRPDLGVGAGCGHEEGPTFTTESQSSQRVRGPDVGIGAGHETGAQQRTEERGVGSEERERNAGGARGPLMWAAMGGVAMGLAALCRPVGLAFVPLAAGYVGWAGGGERGAGTTRNDIHHRDTEGTEREEESGKGGASKSESGGTDGTESTSKSRRMRRGMAGVAVFVAAVGMTLAPWTVRNAMTFHHFLPVSSGFGLHLWRGNNDVARGDTDDGFLYLGHDLWWERVNELDKEQQEAALEGRRRMLERVAGLRVPGSRPVEEVKVDRLYVRLALEWMAYHPETVLRLSAKRLVLLHSAYSRSRTENEDVNARNRIIAAISFYPVLVLGLIGVVVAWGEQRGSVILPAAIVGCAVVSLVTTARTRFRLPVDPFWILLASVAVTSGWGRVRDGVAALWRWAWEKPERGGDTEDEKTERFHHRDTENTERRGGGRATDRRSTFNEQRLTSSGGKTTTGNDRDPSLR